MRQIVLLCSIYLLFITPGLAQNTGIGTVHPTDQLHTTGSVRFQGYSGIGTRVVYMDSNGRLTQPTPPGTVYANNTATPIPDNGCSSNNGATSSINILGQPNISSSNICVRLNITHPNISDLTIYLIAPNNSILMLATGLGPGQDLTGTIFTDAAPNNIVSAYWPYDGRYRAYGNPFFTQCQLTGTLDNFSGMGNGTVSPNGNWTLKVFDNATGSVGTLNNWQLTFDGQGAFGTGGVTGPIPYFNNGALSLSPLTVVGNNIGINTTSPGFTLDVTGTARLTGNTFIGGSIFGSTGLYVNGSLVFNTGSSVVGKVLTSISNTGNADWQLPATANTGFFAELASNFPVPSGPPGVTVPYTITSGTGYAGLPFVDGNTYNAGTYTYTAPAAGVYHFEASVGLSGATAPANTTLVLMAMKGTTPIHKYSQFVGIGVALPLTMTINFQLKLAAGDAISINFNQSSGVVQTIFSTSNSSFFSGHRVY